MLTKNIIYKEYGTVFDNHIPCNLETISRILMLREIEMLKDLLYVSEENSEFKDCVIHAQEEDINYKEFILNKRQKNKFLVSYFELTPPHPRFLKIVSEGGRVS